MIIKAYSELEYIEKYLTALQGLMGLSARELQVAVLMVEKYIILDRAKQNLKTKNARETFDVIKQLKSPESLQAMTKKLNMSFPVFRNYVSGLKHKGFFKNGTINPVCIPKQGQTTVTFELCEDEVM